MVAGDVKMKVKISTNFICPECNREMHLVHNKNDDLVITCWGLGCKNRDKYYELPELEVKEYENRDIKKPD
jgi:transcription elongation factor Elf1